MAIGDILVNAGLVTRDELAQGSEFQRATLNERDERPAGRGRNSSKDGEPVSRNAPVAPYTIAETGISVSSLLNLLLKSVYAASVETATEFAGLMRLQPCVMLELLEEAEQRQVLTVLGSAGAYSASEKRYALTKNGLELAQAAMRRCEYIGPAPVSLEAFREQIRRQLITQEHFAQGAIDHAFADLVVSDELFNKLGPAINSGRSILLYGPPGNGKTSIAERIGSLFKDVVNVPFCFEVDGQIIKVFDPLVHKSVDGHGESDMATFTSDGEPFDRRWYTCRRPVVMVGGELTLEMLDLGFNAEAKFYEAPLHIKALGGVLLIDDFGRQLVSPKALLNRWITPLEDRRDHLKLNSGKSFALPFDELVLFATNLAPNDLMDAAFLRRIPYKIDIPAPTPDVFAEIFRKTAKSAGIEAPEEIVDHVIDEISHWNSYPLAGYQPRFIIEQIRSAALFAKAPMEFQTTFLAMALSNLHTNDTPGHGVEAIGGAPRRPRAK